MLGVRFTPHAPRLTLPTSRSPPHAPRSTTPRPAGSGRAQTVPRWQLLDSDHRISKGRTRPISSSGPSILGMSPSRATASDKIIRLFLNGRRPTDWRAWGDDSSLPAVECAVRTGPMAFPNGSRLGWAVGLTRSWFASICSASHVVRKLIGSRQTRGARIHNQLRRGLKSQSGPTPLLSSHATASPRSLFE